MFIYKKKCLSCTYCTLIYLKKNKINNVKTYIYIFFFVISSVYITFFKLTNNL